MRSPAKQYGQWNDYSHDEKITCRVLIIPVQNYFSAVAFFHDFKGFLKLSVVKPVGNYRRNIKENTIIDGTQDLYYINQPSDKGFISPESSYSENEIEKAIESLEDEFRIPFRMHINGYKYKEIADELGLKIGTVKSRIFFTRQKLMHMLKDYVN